MSSSRSSASDDMLCQNFGVSKPWDFFGTAEGKKGNQADQSYWNASEFSVCLESEFICVLNKHFPSKRSSNGLT